MVCHIREMLADNPGTFELAIRSTKIPFQYSQGQRIIQSRLAVIFSALRHTSDPYRRAKGAAGTSTEADPASEACCHHCMHVGGAHLPGEQ
jgi:hypothetical protein